MASKPISSHKLKTDKTGKTTLEPTKKRTSVSQKIAAAKKPKQKVVRRSV